jgi:hypothetical protein
MTEHTERNIRDRINHIIDLHYPQSECPEWVQYDKFRGKLESEMYSVLKKYIGTDKHIYYPNVLTQFMIVYSSRHLDTGGDYAFEASSRAVLSAMESDTSLEQSTKPESNPYVPKTCIAMKGDKKCRNRVFDHGDQVFCTYHAKHTPEKTA